MNKPAWILTSLARRSLWLAGGIALVVVLTGLIALNRQGWRDRADALERENTELQLAQLRHDVTAQSDTLAERVRELAESDAAIRLLQETTDPSGERLELADKSRDGVDALLVVSAAHAARFSVAIADGNLSEQPPDPVLLPSIEAAAMNAADGAILPSAVSFKDDRWIAVRPVIGHASPAILGWVAASRSLSPTVIAQLERSVGGSLSLQPANGPTAIHSAGSVALRDSSGRVSRVLQLTRSQSGEFTAGASPPAAGLMRYVLAALLLLLGITGAAGVALKRHLRHQRSVDARYKALIDQANDGIVIVDAHTYQVLYTNPAFLNRLGYSNEEAQTLTLTDIFVDGDAAPDSVLARLVEADLQMAINLQQRCKNGSFFDTEVRCNTLDVDGRDVLAYVSHDVSLRRKAEQQLIENQQRLDKMAHHDQLTGLPNRHYLTTFLPQAIAEAKAANAMLGVVFLDLDRFKHINDTRGHETGDKLLQEVAARLRACVRESDVVIRMGGDEFVVVLRNVKNYDEVTLGSSRIIETLNRPIVIDRHSLQTTGSVGVSLYPRDGADMVELLKHSDTAMYQAKDRGRNNVQMFSHAMNRKLKHRVAVEASLREALRLKQLDVHYQPFVNLISRKIVGLEALMRWSHPVHGMIPADQFIPVAEETGLIVPMGNFVLHRTLQTMSAWRKAGIPLVPVSLNVAPAQLQRGELQSTISTLLKTHNLRPDLLLLEMTERAVFDSHSPAAGDNRQDTMARLRDLGIKIAIDDFGTGYSSLSYLKNWRVDALKIDRSFVRDLVTDSSDLAIVSAIIAIARHLHIEVIAEGIEAYQQVEILRRLGCSVGQGFLFARPMPADDILKLLRNDAEPPKEEEEDMLAVFSAGRG
ncbi:MAG TPA: EAL domain-containing protein [Steroidobacteraceae bacterium]|jgi:diguanylate cyclase (GGDEF)-like protein/PAS domain S-box-containing protein|nr:EAL domain-containing protein [Steroidobacteraceae bacterium]